MNKTCAIALKEVSALFFSPMAYIVLFVVLSVFNTFFYIIVDESREASLRDMFKVMEFMFVFIVPLLTMKVFAEEKSKGTMEFLMTTPTTNTAIVVGKYVGSLVFFSLIIFCTGIYYILLEMYGEPDRFTVAAGYFGIWLEGAFFIAIGVMCSSWTRNQIVAAITTYAIIFSSYFSISFIKYTSGAWQEIIRYAGTWSHLENFAAGLINTSDIVYYLSGIVLCIFITRIIIENRFAYKIILLIFMSALLVALFTEVNYLAHFYNVRVDLTKNKQHTLSESTKEVLSALEDEIKISVLYSGLSPKYLEDMLNEYSRVSAARITYEIIDPLVDIGYAAQFGQVIKSSEYKAIIQAGSERRDVDFTESPLNEDQINNAIIRVTRPVRRVCFLAGHGEYGINDDKDQGLTTFRKLLLGNNIVAETVVLETVGKVPDHCDGLVVAGAQAAISEKEEGLINAYLENGGDALFLIEHTVVTTPDKPLTEKTKDLNPSLNSILNKWGVRVEQDVVVDLVSHASGDVGSPATRNYMAHPAIKKDLDFTFYIRPRSISIMPRRRDTLRAVPFVLTVSEEKSWGETDRYLNVKFDEGIDRRGPVPISFVIFEPKEEGESSDTRIIVFTDADFISNLYVDHYSNAQMGLNILNWITESDYEVFVNKNEMKVVRIELNSRQRRVVIITLAAIPIFIIFLGMMVWIRQRN